MDRTAVTFSLRRLEYLALAFLGWLILWNGSGEFRPGMDAMTYGALAKHILATSDWSRLHYSQQAYADFYQSPPLAIWMTAVVFKFFGASDLTQKILPTFFAFATVAGVVAWARRWRSEWTGFVAGIVLLFSFRFTKYSVSLMLDPFQAAFMVWSVYFGRLSLERAERSGGIAFLAGLCAAGALLSKGVPAIVAVVAVALLFVSQAAYGRLASYLAGLLAPLLAWFALADGWNFVTFYLKTSVAGRAGGDSLEGHLSALRNLGRVYWPWLPFWVWSVIRSIRSFKAKGPRAWLLDPTAPAVFVSLGIVAGFTFSGHYLEQYGVIFYPFAAVVVADRISGAIEKYRVGVVKFFLGLSIAYAMVLAAFPIHVQGNEYLNPLRIVVERAARECDGSKIQRFQFSTHVAEIWYATAMGSWYTPWDIRSESGLVSPETTGSQILVGERDERVHPDWVPTGIYWGVNQVFERKGLGACPKP